MPGLNTFAELEKAIKKQVRLYGIGPLIDDGSLPLDYVILLRHSVVDLRRRTARPEPVQGFFLRSAFTRMARVSMRDCFRRLNRQQFLMLEFLPVITAGVKSARDAYEFVVDDFGVPDGVAWQRKGELWFPGDRVEESGAVTEAYARKWIAKIQADGGLLTEWVPASCVLSILSCLMTLRRARSASALEGLEGDSGCDWTDLGAMGPRIDARASTDDELVARTGRAAMLIPPLAIKFVDEGSCEALLGLLSDYQERPGYALFSCNVYSLDAAAGVFAQSYSKYVKARPHPRLYGRTLAETARLRKSLFVSDWQIVLAPLYVMLYNRIADAQDDDEEAGDDLRALKAAMARLIVGRAAMKRPLPRQFKGPYPDAEFLDVEEHPEVWRQANALRSTTI